MLVHGVLKHVFVHTIQKIYLFGAEGTTQDRGWPRPASAAASSPAKRVKTSSGEEDAAEEHQPGSGQEEEEEEPHHQAERGSADVETAEKDVPSTSKHSTVLAMPFTQLPSETGRYCCAETRQELH